METYPYALGRWWKQHLTCLVSIWWTWDQWPHRSAPFSLCCRWTVKVAQMSWGAHAVMFNVSPWHCGLLCPVLLSYLVHAAIAPREGCLCEPFWCHVFPEWQPAFIILPANAIYIFEGKDFSLPSSFLPPQSPNVLPCAFGGYSLTWSWGHLLWKSHSVWRPLRALGQASSATHRVSKLPFPCCGVGITLGMSRLSGPKVGSQHTLICSRRNKVQAGREVTLRIGGCPCNAICSALLTAHGLGEAALLVPPDEPSLLCRGHGAGEKAFPTAPVVGQIVTCLGIGTQVLLNA